ncbi:MAG: DUF4136 domain-containing protein [Verrucomicrobia bacterium]|nr:DUF4136 domain-containing protein [Verrucomicrobiota bacterium]
MQTTDFHILQSFAMGEVELSGMEWTEASRESLNKITLTELAAQLDRCGFTDGGSEADFIVRAYWKKALKLGLRAPSSFSTIPEMRGYDEDAMRPQVLCSLTVELYDPKNNAVFWRAELPNCLNVLSLSQDNIAEAIAEAMASFPQRIQLDPNLGLIK